MKMATHRNRYGIASRSWRPTDSNVLRSKHGRFSDIVQIQEQPGHSGFLQWFGLCVCILIESDTFRYQNKNQRERKNTWPSHDMSENIHLPVAAQRKSSQWTVKTDGRHVWHQVTSLQLLSQAMIKVLFFNTCQAHITTRSMPMPAPACG